MKKMIMVILLVSSVSYGKSFDVKNFVSKLAGKNVNKLADKVVSSPHTKQMFTKKVSLESPPIDIVTKIAKNISNKSKFGDELISNTDYPSAVIRQYTKFGDAYLSVMRTFNKNSMALKKVDIELVNKKFPSIPNIKFNSSKVFNDKMVQALQYTGKKGWEVSTKLVTFAKNNPKKSTIYVLMAWYATDPDSFFEQKEKLIAFLESTAKEVVSDATKITLGASEGIANGFMSVAKEKMTVSNMFVLFLLFMAFMVWKLRSYIGKYFSIKLENRLEKVKNKSKNIEKNNEGLL